MEITVKHEFTMSPELESFFSRIMAPIHTEMTTPVKKTPVKEVKQVAEPIAEVAEQLKEDVKEPVKATATDITVEQLRAAVSAKASEKDVEGKTKREALKELLTSFGSKNVTELDKAKYADFLTAVNAL